MGAPTWSWQYYGVSQTFQDDDAHRLERLFRQECTAPIQVTLKTSWSIPITVTIQNTDLNFMFVNIFGNCNIFLSRKHEKNTGCVIYYTSLRIWFPYLSEDADLVCEAWQYRRSSVSFVRSGIIYVVFLSNGPWATQFNVTDRKTRFLYLFPLVLSRAMCPSTGGGTRHPEQPGRDGAHVEYMLTALFRGHQPPP